MQMLLLFVTIHCFRIYVMRKTIGNFNRCIRYSHACRCMVYSHVLGVAIAVHHTRYTQICDVYRNLFRQEPKIMPNTVICIVFTFLAPFRDKDNLSTRDKGSAPDLSIIWRLHCIAIIDNITDQVVTVHLQHECN